MVPTFPDASRVLILVLLHSSTSVFRLHRGGDEEVRVREKIKNKKLVPEFNTKIRTLDAAGNVGTKSPPTSIASTP